MVSYTAARFGGHSCRGSGDMFLVCHVMGREPLKVSHNFDRLGSHKNCGSGDIML